MADINAAEDGRAVVNRERIFIGNCFVALRAATMVVKVHREGAEYAVHDNIGDSHIFDNSTSPAPRLKADATVGSDKDAVGNNDVTYTSAHLTANYHAAVPM